MPRRPPPIEIEPRETARFSAAQRHEILLRQMAPETRMAHCASCRLVIAHLNDAGVWVSLRPHDFDHEAPRAQGGETSVENGQAICRGVGRCHGAKTKADNERSAKSKRQALETGQQARRRARKAAGKKPLLRARPMR